MSSSTTFLIAPHPSSLHSSPALHLLPFSLGSSSLPYTTASAPLSTYFHPRPCPPGIPSVVEGTPIAAFRGRQLVGQTIDVPRGYRGVILTAGRRPDQGGVEVRLTGTPVKGKDRHLPLTPASSSASTFSVEDEPGGMRRSPRKPRGAGQVPLARPKTRQAVSRSAPKKRYRLDSDDDDDDESAEIKPAMNLVRTPSKRMKITGMMGLSPVKGPGLPAIVVQAPTPHKRVAPPVHHSSNQEEGRIELGSDVEVEPEVKVEEAIVPSPATEDDPPSFPITPDPQRTRIPSSSLPADLVHVEGKVGKAGESESEYGTSIRALRPTSTFDSFTLWTLDAPLAGFRTDELEGQNGEDAGGETCDGMMKRGWWRTGGAGEGGDEVVRAMGEWLGLVELLNKPVYLDGIKDEDDSEGE